MEIRVTKVLKYEFSEAEDRLNAKSLARANRSLEEAELKRKQIMGDLKADEARVLAEIGRLSRFVNDGYDFRETECKVILNDPRNGIKSLYRLDTGELVEQIAMELHEMQDKLDLNNPPPAEDDEEDDEDESGNRRPY